MVQHLERWHAERGDVGVAYPIHADPTRIKAVPSKAVRMRKTKNAARFGASAVPRLQAQKSTAVIWLI